MYINATNSPICSRRSTTEIIRAVREALQPFGRRLQRVQVDVQQSGERHVCRLRAWSERGRTVVVERCAVSRRQAVEFACESLEQTLARAPQSGRRASAARTELSRSGVSVSTAESPRPSQPHPRVLLSLHELDPSASSLHWSCVLADALHADLDVCRVLANVPATASLPPGPERLDATRRLLTAAGETKRWCEQALPGAVLSERLIFGAADYSAKAGLLARRRGIDWIVVAAHPGCGAAAVTMARVARCPVLVSREPTTRSTLLVATEVEACNAAALRRAARLAIALHAPVLAFQDLRALSPTVAHTPQVDALTLAWAQIQREHLSIAPDQRLPELDVLLAHGGDRVGALLAQARREDAEMIVVSFGADDPNDPAADVARDVADGALRSVLIVPRLGMAPSRGASLTLEEEQSATRSAVPVSASSRRASASPPVERRASLQWGVRRPGPLPPRK
jgi:hypothetical protein